MENNTRLGLVVSLFVLVGFPILFSIVSIITGEWRYLLFSIPGSFTAGFVSLIFIIHQIKKERRSS
ncbi:hypothetical protein [Bacillus sp. NEB1478]|uniref:hypothetical protein n=1 Tax=Bacillus sp. NEB1478 TaxID=3073816 RepID=UPI002872F114|nr:hypothetical protein [Bacillus sp. NEB1478]WNB91094.1 hypothetical protein RGB74_14435 [Bacillus sp. NEB1478]